MRKIENWILVHLAVCGKCGCVICVEMQGPHESEKHSSDLCDKAYWALHDSRLQPLQNHVGKEIQGHYYTYSTFTYRVRGIRLGDRGATEARV